MQTMEDPIQRHPTRAEQLDILTTLMADTAAAFGDRATLLDLGCGTGYVAHKLLRKHPGVRVTGVDLSAEALAGARENLAGLDGEFTGIEGNLETPRAITLPVSTYSMVCSCLTFHDLDDAQKQDVIGWVSERLEPGGLFLIYDRLRLAVPALFELQRSLWTRLADVHGRAMRTADSYDAYEADLGPGNRPGALEDYFAWYRDAGFDSACLHLHGNIALLAGTLRA